MAKALNNTDKERWARTLAAKEARLATPRATSRPCAGMGPNKASGHKGGISRQGSKRG